MSWETVSAAVVFARNQFESICRDGFRRCRKELVCNLRVSSLTIALSRGTDKVTQSVHIRQ
jgi:hypothetical protein